MFPAQYKLVATITWHGEFTRVSNASDASTLQPFRLDIT